VRLPRADARIATTATLLGMTASAALTFTQPPQLRTTATKPAVDAPADATAPLAGPVKIIGAAPRSENCAEQVWPYIEQRCLTVAIARAPAAQDPCSDSRVGVVRDALGRTPSHVAGAVIGLDARGEESVLGPGVEEIVGHVVRHRIIDRDAAAHERNREPGRSRLIGKGADDLWQHGPLTRTGPISCRPGAIRRCGRAREVAPVAPTRH
jgi:hypothetical protein